MLKSDRDQLMNRMGQEGRNNFRQLLRGLIAQRKTSPESRVSPRELLEAHGGEFDADVRNAFQAIVTRDEMGPMQGQDAVDFTLKRAGSDEYVTLSSFKGRRPVALIFGSYT